MEGIDSSFLAIPEPPGISITAKLLREIIAVYVCSCAKGSVKLIEVGRDPFVP
jgi:hypothetical protein